MAGASSIQDFPLVLVKVHGFFLAGEKQPAVSITIATVAETKFLVSVVGLGIVFCTASLIVQKLYVRWRTCRTHEALIAFVQSCSKCRGTPLETASQKMWDLIGVPG